MSDSERNRNSGGTRRATVIAGLAAVLLMLGGGRIGLGLGNGLLPGTGSGQNTAQEAQKDADTSQTESSKETADADAAGDVIVVAIEQDAVTINGNPAADAAELRAYIEEYNKDGRIFRLTEDQSILETYEWVTDTFAEMGIELERE